MAIDALELRPGPQARSRVADLASRRGRAFAAVGQWAQAREAFEFALASLDQDAREERCKVVLDLAMVAFWQFDTAYMRQLGEEGIHLAQQIGRRDLEAKGLAWLAPERQSAGELGDAIALYRQALDSEEGVRTVALCHAPLTYYLAGRAGRGRGDRPPGRAGSPRTPGHGLHHVTPYPAWRLDSSGPDGTEKAPRSLPRPTRSAAVRRHVAEGARDGYVGRVPPGPVCDSIAPRRSAGSSGPGAQRGFRPASHQCQCGSVVHVPCADMMSAAPSRFSVKSATQSPLRADGMAGCGVSDSARRWLRSLRLAARGTMSLPQRRRVSSRVEREEDRGTEALGLATRALALHGLGKTQDALDELEQAAGCATTTGDPALQFRILAARLAIEPTEAVAQRGAALAASIEREIPDAAIAECFARAEPVQLVRRLAPSPSF